MSFLHVTQSDDTVKKVKICKPFVLNKSKKRKLYKNLKKYVLTENQLEVNGYPRPDPVVKGKAIMKNHNQNLKFCDVPNSRICSRCDTLYKVDEKGMPVDPAECKYHNRSYKRRNQLTSRWETVHVCCNGTASQPCCHFSTHVSENFDPDNLEGFVETYEKSHEGTEEYFEGIYALDCEMCYTTQGNEVTSITVVDSNAKIVYQKLVLPDNPIIDYNTKFSGITEKDMQGVVVNLDQVQKDLLKMFTSKTILIGHGLDADLHALKLCHETVIDTVVVFPHVKGPPFKSSLRYLADKYLKRTIQGGPKGHSSAEDAFACMDLMKWKARHYIYKPRGAKVCVP